MIKINSGSAEVIKSGTVATFNSNDITFTIGKDETVKLVMIFKNDSCYITWEKMVADVTLLSAVNIKVSWNIVE